MIRFIASALYLLVRRYNLIKTCVNKWRIWLAIYFSLLVSAEQKLDERKKKREAKAKMMKKKKNMKLR